MELSEKYQGNISWKNAASHVLAWACGENDLEQFLRQVAALPKTKIGDKVEDRGKGSCGLSEFL